MLRRLLIRALALGWMTVAVAAFPAAAQDSSTATPESVDIYVHTARTVTIPGLTDLQILDPDVVAADRAGEAVRLTGLRQGETLALAYVHGVTTSVVLRVVMPPMVLPPPSLMRLDLERGIGLYGSDIQLSHYNGQYVVLANSLFSWSQQIGDRRLELSTEVQDLSATGQPGFNFRAGTVAYLTPGLQVRALDYNIDFTGAEVGDRAASYLVSTVLPLRGAEVRLAHGSNTYTFFGGTTVPYYFLTLATTKTVAGFTMRHQVSDNLAVYGGVGYVNGPLIVNAFNAPRHNSVMQIAGFHYTPTKRWSINGLGGTSNRGGMGRGDVSYTALSWTAYASAQKSAPFFPLNQMQSLFDGITDYRAGVTVKTSTRFTENVEFEHAVTESGTSLINPGKSDYLNAGVGVLLTRSEQLQFAYTHSRSEGGFFGTVRTGNRYQTTLNSVFRPRWANSFQFIAGSLQDSLGFDSNDNLQIYDSFTFPIKIGDMDVSFTHQRTDPSLIRRLSNELNLLTPELQALFFANPLAFEEANLPPDVRRLLDSQIPTDTAFYTSAHFAIGQKVTVNPNFAFSRVTDGVGNSNWTKSFGYQLHWQVRPSLELRSGLTSLWAADQSALPGHEGFQRSYILTFGFLKTFSGNPLPIGLMKGSRTIEGRVFRDENINGVYNSGEPGLAGIVVALDRERTVKTDSTGHYKFTNVSADEHRISIALEQFTTPVRMTTSSEFTVNLAATRVAGADFGVVNFARLMGSVYNDLRFECKRQFDSKPIGDVHLLLSKNGELVKTIAVPGSGEFEMTDITPGDYDVAVDTSTVPPDYTVPVEHTAVHIEPVSSVAIDIPLRAMRSIAGHVYLRVVENPTPEQKNELNIETRGARKKKQEKTQAAEPTVKLVPLVGVQLTADHTVVKSDANGAFILRNLPAGDLTVTLLPVKPLPAGMKVPAGTVHLPAEPIHVEGATIVISNPDLVPYLTNLKEQQPAVIAALP